MKAVTFALIFLCAGPAVFAKECLLEERCDNRNGFPPAVNTAFLPQEQPARYQPQNQFQTDTRPAAYQAPWTPAPDYQNQIAGARRAASFNYPPNAYNLDQIQRQNADVAAFYSLASARASAPGGSAFEVSRDKQRDLQEESDKILKVTAELNKKALAGLK